VFANRGGKKVKGSAISKAVSRYISRHYRKIYVRKDYHDKIRNAAHRVGCTIQEFVHKLFDRYGERLVEELLAERSKSARATMHVEAPPRRVEAPKVEATTRAPKPEVEVPEPGFVVIDLGVYGRFKVREEDWRLFVEIVESSKPVVEDTLKKLPAHLWSLFRRMWSWGAVRFNAKTNTWMINYSRFRIIRAR
jgi:hypothetical protein